MLSLFKNFHDLNQFFEEKEINTDSAGFFNHPNFIRIEQENSDFLEYYAKFVKLKPYSSSYCSKVKALLPVVSKLLTKLLREDGRLGACIDMSGAVSLMLNRHNIWNYVVSGSLTITFLSGNHESQYFWSVDPRESVAPHAWLCVPPFDVIDLTINRQPYGEGQPPLIPELVVEEKITPFEAELIDIVNPLLIKQGMAEFGVPESELMDKIYPRFTNFTKEFLPNLIKKEHVTCKYIPAAIIAPEKELEDYDSLTLQGKKAIEIYKATVEPVIKKHF